MKKQILWGVGGLGLGLLLAFLGLIISAPGLMVSEAELEHTFDDAVALFEETVKDHGWKIPTVHNLQGTMDKFGYDVAAVKVFELCHPDHASKILTQDNERIVSNMMPCRVSIYEKSNGKVYVSWMNTGLMGGLFGGLVAEVMDDASAESLAMIQELL
jgi:uncharacterized protein (DUF302 family)